MNDKMAFRCQCVVLVCAIARGPGLCEPAVPSPGEIATTVRQLWSEHRLADLQGYINDLYARAPGYVPAFVAAIISMEVFGPGLLEDVIEMERFLLQETKRHPDAEARYPVFIGLLQMSISDSTWVLNKLKADGRYHLERSMSPEDRRHTFPELAAFRILDIAPDVTIDSLAKWKIGATETSSTPREAQAGQPQSLGPKPLDGHAEAPLQPRQDSTSPPSVSLWRYGYFVALVGILSVAVLLLVRARQRARRCG